MLKIFRRARQNLIAEGNTGKYLKYAIGEILLVVIGILIALQINNWNEQKKEKAKEQAFLKEINLDFKSNKTQLDSIISYNKVSLHASARVLEIIKGFNLKNPKANVSNSHLTDSIGYYYRLMWRNKSFNPKNGSVEALLNSSSFDVIKNDSLRRNLISWKDVLNDYLEEEEFAINFLFNEYGPWARENFDPDVDDDPEYITAFFSKRHRNFMNQRAGDLYNNLTTVEEEGVITMIDDIIRLTETNHND
ncbi:hypothetical protein MTsPCn9_13040 [Croceitalea sp. MTPC9]|uniref:DUF6090 family protein n=1 Tax=unclassified Croceitalea TaxID=2632280 RepID=UPI002B3B18D3|nr:hypothetical protein MTsPCn6_16090 [Croceitalea sp. MTPC6]GMN16368.1 hypothetical protein MTsPCn9_13040 [Croceitalea sp. MTPC9]